MAIAHDSKVGSKLFETNNRLLKKAAAKRAVDLWLL
jgi:hypothetical protein